MKMFFGIVLIIAGAIFFPIGFIMESGLGILILTLALIAICAGIWLLIDFHRARKGQSN